MDGRQLACMAEQNAASHYTGFTCNDAILKNHSFVMADRKISKNHLWIRGPLMRPIQDLT